MPDDELCAFVSHALAVQRKVLDLLNEETRMPDDPSQVALEFQAACLINLAGEVMAKTIATRGESARIRMMTLVKNLAVYIAPTPQMH